MDPIISYTLYHTYAESYLTWKEKEKAFKEKTANYILSKGLSTESKEMNS